jgi:Na+-translocating ferredoxin:NAD+ oxidoreductase RnfG subunit
MREFDATLWAPVVFACAAAPVQAMQYLTVEQAQRTLFPQAEAFAATPVRLTPELRARIAAGAGSPVRGEVQRVWTASRGGMLLGYFIVDNAIGKHELITYAVGIGADGAVRGIEIMDYREARGGEVRDSSWRAQFVGKRRNSPLRLDEDIQNISGATLSCRHITDGVRRLLVLYDVVLK